MTHLSLHPLNHSTLGFERFFEDANRLLKADQRTTQSFPPHNIIKLDENHYLVELAIAGFSKEDIDISVEENTLTIKGDKSVKETDVTYIHRGIGTRSFTKTLTIADTVEVKGAEFKDGILRIALENIIPDHKKPRKIQIDNDLSKFKSVLLQENKT